MATIKYRITEVLKQSGKTQKDLADYLGIFPHNVSNWDRGEYRPSDENLAKTCEFLDCTPGDLQFVDKAA